VKVEEKLNKKYEQRQRGRGGKFQRDRTYSRGERSYVEQNKKDSPFKKEDKDNSTYRRDDRNFYHKENPNSYLSERYRREERGFDKRTFRGTLSKVVLPSTPIISFN